MNLDQLKAGNDLYNSPLSEALGWAKALAPFSSPAPRVYATNHANGPESLIDGYVPYQAYGPVPANTQQAANLFGDGSDGVTLVSLGDNDQFKIDHNILAIDGNLHNVAQLTKKYLSTGADVVSGLTAVLEDFGLTEAQVNTLLATMPGVGSAVDSALGIKR